MNVDISKNTANLEDVIADHAAEVEAEADLAQAHLREEEDILLMIEEGEDAPAHLLLEETEDVTPAQAAEVPEEAEIEAAAHPAEMIRERIMEIIYKLKFKN